MCGIFGVFSTDGRPLPGFDAQAALDAIRHRGPDDEGMWRNATALLGARRLSIIDPAGGHQPMASEDESIHLAMNGEIFDYEPLLESLQSGGHRFHSRCDTEVALHLFEEALHSADDASLGASIRAALDRIDGQYAIAVHDARAGSFLIARDRTGICPLFYALRGGMLVFASEMKSIFASGLVQPALNPRGIDAVTTFGCIPPPTTIFDGVYSLPAGHFLVAGGASPGAETALRISEYWDIPYPDAGEYEQKSEREWAEQLRGALEASARRRLRADVPVGLYLSGGIDSATVGAMISGRRRDRVGWVPPYGERDERGSAGGAEDRVEDRVYSIGFPERTFDESHRTHRIATALGLREQYLRYKQSDLATDFPRLLYHAEAPMMSTESVPLFALSALASHEVKVILTGEGSDEALGGYAYFYPEVFFSRIGGTFASVVRSLARPAVSAFAGRRNPLSDQESEEAWGRDVFGFYPAGGIMSYYMRRIRETTYSDSANLRIAAHSDAELVHLPNARMGRWDQLNRSLYVSSRTFLQSHLLAGHGDRALMAHSVEGRYPFLDREVQELLARVPPKLKVRLSLYPAGEKYILRRAMRHDLPTEVLARRKKPFLAPFGTPFTGSDAPEYVRHLLSPATLAEFGHFDPAKITSIRDRLASGSSGRSGGPMQESVRRTMDGISLVFALSVQVVEHIIRSSGFRSYPSDLP